MDDLSHAKSDFPVLFGDEPIVSLDLVARRRSSVAIVFLSIIEHSSM